MDVVLFQIINGLVSVPAMPWDSRRAAMPSPIMPIPTKPVAAMFNAKIFSDVVLTADTTAAALVVGWCFRVLLVQSGGRSINELAFSKKNIEKK